MAKPSASTIVDCNVCGKTISRKADLARHLRTHATNKEELMHACPYIGCLYRALQRSNLRTHLNVHSRERPHKCPEEGCQFSTSDPGSLTRHRKERHGYEPKGNSSVSHGSTSTRKAARRRRKVSPYTTSSSPGRSVCSVSPSDPSTPSSSILLSDDHVEEGSKNTSPAYSTELITRRAQVNDSHLALNIPLETVSPLNSGLLTALEAPVAKQPQLPVQGNLYVVDTTAQPTTEMNTSDEVFNNFLAQFNDWQLEVAPVYAASSLPTPVVQHTVYNPPLPTPAALPSYEIQPTVDNALYDYYRYSTEAMSFDTQVSQFDSIVAPDMDIYPQAVYPRDVDRSYFYTTYSGTSGLVMQGFYL